MATLTQAGTCDDLTGNPESDPESRQAWRDALAACEWVERMETYRADLKLKETSL